MAPWRCIKRCARSSARPPSFSGAKATRSATSSTTCRSASARGSRRSCGVLSGERRADGDAAPHGSRQVPGGRISQRRRQRPRRAGRNADRPHAAPLDPPAAVTRHDHRRRASAESHPPREAQRETVAWWTEEAAVGGHRCPRSRQGLPAPEGMRRYAAVGQRASRTRPTTGTRCLRGERRVESHPSRRRVLTAVGTSPSLELQRDALRAEGIDDAAHPYHDSRFRRTRRPARTRQLFARPGEGRRAQAADRQSVRACARET